MKVFKAEFESGNWCYIFAETEHLAWRYFDKVMYESYNIISFKEVGKTIAGIVYVYSGVTKNKKLEDSNGTLRMCSQERTSRWYEIIWYRFIKHSWWQLIHSIKYFEHKREKEISELFKENNTK
ncbi:MAG: hypothetical protein WA816_07575 [Bacteroidales bacterium]